LWFIGYKITSKDVKKNRQFGGFLLNLDGIYLD